MNSTIKAEVKAKLISFLEKFEKQKSNLKSESEQTMRSWIDEFLFIFGWDCQNPMQVQQEKMLTKDEKLKLKSINSNHTKPDYTLKNGHVRKNFFDAKDLQDDIRRSIKIAFQARSYGWSAAMSCSIITNIEEIAFYSCDSMPSENERADKERIYLRASEYIQNFDLLFDLLYRENVINGVQERRLKKNIPLVKKIDLDSAFAEFLSQFRYKLAENIYLNNKDIVGNNIEINTITQTIINRIIFIRICEGRELEEKDVLLNMIKHGFWRRFKEISDEEYEEYYSGPIFKSYKLLDEVKIDNEIFNDFIKDLYNGTPYKFDVIPVEVMASMYEKFLAKEIDISCGEIRIIDKDFYVKQQGAISTPKYMVEFVLNETFEGFKEVNNLSGLFETKILEPACGSGTFIIGILDLLEKKAIQLYRNNLVTKEEVELFTEVEGHVFATVELKRRLITECIYGIDMDYQAIEVAKISLALKLIDNYQLPSYNEAFGLCRKLLLSNVGDNIVHGNTLIGMDILDLFNDIKIDYLEQLVPINIKENNKDIFQRNGGFDFIVGNPPYVETKNYIDTLPYCREYFKHKYNFDDHKADMSIYFIEKCLTLLNNKGKLGFICQKRFFKTNYGMKTRKFLADNKMLNKIVDFDTEKIFRDRTTYVALMVFDNNKNDKFRYLNLEVDEINLENKLLGINDTCYIEKNVADLSHSGWHFSKNTELEGIINKLSKKFNSLDSLIKLGVCDIHGGIQVLRNDVYYINNFEIDNAKGLISGVNRRKESSKNKVELELEICRGIIANKSLVKFQELKPKYYAIVPYTLDRTKPITFDEIKKEYPLCAEYLERQKDYIIANNKEVYAGNDWVLFTRRTNLDKYEQKKIMFPMTSKEVIASYISTPCYPDNSNMWYLNLKDEEDEFYRAMTAILNSKLFSVMTIHYSNPQAGSYKKMNKQFIKQGTIPYNKIKKSSEIIEDLNKMVLDIEMLVNKKNIMTEGAKRINEQLLENNFDKLNEYVNKIYELSSEEEEVINSMYKKYMQD